MLRQLVPFHVCISCVCVSVSVRDKRGIISGKNILIHLHETEGNEEVGMMILTIAANIMNGEEDWSRTADRLHIPLDVDVALSALFQLDDVPLCFCVFTNGRERKGKPCNHANNVIMMIIIMNGTFDKLNYTSYFVLSHFLSLTSSSTFRRYSRSTDARNDLRLPPPAPGTPTLPVDSIDGLRWNMMPSVISLLT